MNIQIHRKSSSTTRAKSASLALLSAVFASASTAAHAAVPNLETFVMVTHGTADDRTSGAPDAVFNTIGNYGGSVPNDASSNPSVLASEHIAGTYQVTDSATAPTLTDSYASSGGYDPNRELPYYFTGSTTATAAYGQLKSGSQSTITGNPGYGDVANNSESYATVLDTLTTTSPHVVSSTNGTMTLSFTLDGSLSCIDNNLTSPDSAGFGSAGLEFICSSSTDGSTPNLLTNRTTLFAATGRIAGAGAGIGVYSTAYGGDLPPGFTITVGPTLASGSVSSVTLSGSATVSVTIPIVFGSAAAFDMGMLTYALPDQDSDENSLFQDTATLSGIQVFDNNGNAVNDFSIASGSGTQYDANGVHLAGSAAAPEPGSLALLALGSMPAVKWIARRRRRGAK